MGIVLAVAVLGVGSFFVARGLAPVDTSPVMTQEIGFDDVPAQVGDWVAHPVQATMTGMIYLDETREDRNGVALMITVGSSFGTFDLGVMSLSNKVTHAHGRVVCGDAEFAFYDCYIDTDRFGSVYASATGRDVPPEDVTAIAKAIAAAHP